MVIFFFNAFKTFLFVFYEYFLVTSFFALTPRTSSGNRLKFSLSPCIICWKNIIVIKKKLLWCLAKFNAKTKAKVLNWHTEKVNFHLFQALLNWDLIQLINKLIFYFVSGVLMSWSSFRSAMRREWSKWTHSSSSLCTVLKFLLKYWFNWLGNLKNQQEHFKSRLALNSNLLCKIVLKYDLLMSYTNAFALTLTCERKRVCSPLRTRLVVSFSSSETVLSKLAIARWYQC